MSLVSRLACSTNRLLARNLVLRPLPHHILQSVKHSSTDGSSGKKGGKNINGHIEPEEINPADPHRGNESGDVNVGPGLMTDKGRKFKVPKTAEDFANPSPEFWINWGWDKMDKNVDRIHGHITMFMVMTLMIYGGAWMVYYFPDVRMDNWFTREAYLEMERRKKLGEPYISRDYVPRHLITLPTDEELGDMEIII